MKLSKEKIGDIVIYIIVLLCFAYPISAIASVILSLPSTPVNMTYRAVCLLLSVIVISYMMIIREIRIKKSILPLLAFLFIYLIRLIVDTYIRSVSYYDKLIDIYGYYLGSIVIPILAIAFAFKYSNQKKLVTLSLFTLLISNILLIYFYIRENGWGITPEMLMNRAEITTADSEGSVVNPISFSLYGGYLFLLSLTILFIKKPELPKILKYFSFFGLLLGCFNIILGSSRGPLIFCIVGLILILVLALSRIKLNFLNYAKIFLISVGLFFIFSKLTDKVDIEFAAFDRLIRFSEDVKSGEKEERNLLFDEAWNMFTSSPMLGKKFALDSTGSYPHNIILEILMSLGLFGLFIYLIIILNTCISFLNLNKNRTHVFRIVVLLILSVGISLTSGSIYQSVDNWNLIALTLAAHANPYE
ncbi:O-Antigen ligase [compost metagenome]